MSEVSETKRRQRATWAAGDYPAIAAHLEPASATLVATVGVGAGVRVLDVATGSGNAALVAAALGAEVTGLDLAPSLLDVARRRAEEAELRIAFVEGDAEDLPFADGSFDRVVSVFGAMFAPDQRRAAAELARVCRPGGRIGLCAWTPDGIGGRMLSLLRSRLPAPADGPAPALWGTEQRLRELFAGTAAKLSFEQRQISFEHDSAESWVAFNERAVPPVVVARDSIGAAGWAHARADLVALFAAADERDGDGFAARAEYLETVIELPG